MMSEQETLQERLNDLECKFVFQQETIEALNTEVTKQWNVIDQLRKQLERMTDQIVTLEDQMGDPRNEPPPPHY